MSHTSVQPPTHKKQDLHTQCQNTLIEQSLTRSSVVIQYLVTLPTFIPYMAITYTKSPYAYPGWYLSCFRMAECCVQIQTVQLHQPKKSHTLIVVLG